MDYGNIKKRARELRKNQTSAEDALWGILRNRRFHGLRFLGQHPIRYEVGIRRYFFIADFYCAEGRLAFELDRKVLDSLQERDAERDRMIRNLGLKVLRIKNEELQNMDRAKHVSEFELGVSFSPSLLADSGLGSE